MRRRQRVHHTVTDAWRHLSGVCGRWYRVILDGTVPHPLVWSAGALPKRRGLARAVRDRAMLPGPAAIWACGWVNVPASAINAGDVSHWSYSVGVLVECVAFSGTLHWPVGGADLGGGCVSQFEMLILY